MVVRNFSKGKYGERVTTELLSKIGNCVSNKNGDITQWKKYDLLLGLEDGSVATFEVKYDRMASWTGNIAIEYFNPKTNLPSGIDCTEAKYWLIVLNKGEVWLAETSRLKAYIKDNPPHKDVFGGDANSYMKIYKMNPLLNAIFTRIDQLSSEELLLLLQAEADERSEP